MDHIQGLGFFAPFFAPDFDAPAGSNVDAAPLRALLALAEQGRLGDEAELRRQFRRLLDDPALRPTISISEEPPR